MTTLDYWVIVLFSAIVVTAGLVLGRRKSDMKTFFSGGGAVPWALSGLSLFMSFFSAGTFVVWGSIAYDLGFVSVMIQWGMCLAGFLIGFFIAPRWRATGVLTAGEFIRRRFGKTAQSWYVYLFLLLAMASSGAFLYPVAKLVNISTGFSLPYAIIIIGVLVMVYTAVGGLWAVIVTDVLQFVVLSAAVAVVVPLALDLVGGVDGLVSATPDGFFQLFAGDYTPWFWAAFAFYNMVFIGGNWSYVQRYTSVDSPKSARKAGYLFGALYLVSPVLWMIPPMALRALGDANLTGLENEGAYFVMCQKVLPAGMLGLMLAGMIFATASAVNTTLNMSAAVFTNDIFRRLVPSAGEDALMRIARGSTIAFGVVTIMLALLVPAMGGIVEVVLSIGALTGVPLYGPPIWALFSKRQTPFSILFTTLFSLAVNLFFKFISPGLLHVSLDRMQEMVLGVSLPIALLVVFEVWYRNRPSRQYIESGIPPAEPMRKDTPEGDVEAGSSQQNRLAIKTVAWAMTAVGTMIFILGLVADRGRGAVLGIALIIMLLGTGLLFTARKNPPTRR